MDKDKIIAYLNNDGEDFDKGEVEQWIEKNRNEFNRIKYVWEKAGVNTEENPNIEKAWMRINPKNRNNDGNKKKKLKILATSFQRIAAVLVLAISIGFVIYHQYVKTTGTETFWVEVKNNSDHIRQVQLNDGSELWLNLASKIQYPKDFATKTRKVHIEGEVFFEVKHNNKRPFIVYTENSVTSDLGTSFNVKADVSGDVQVTVVSGSVAFSGIENKHNKVVLKKGEMGLFTARNQRIEKQQNENLNFLAWKTGKLTFSKIPLEKVCEILSNYYKTKVYIGSDALRQINLTANYDHKKLGEVLEIMRLTLNIQYQYRDSSVVLSFAK